MNVVRAALAFALAAFSFPHGAAAFELGVAPSRMEITAKAGGRMGQSLTLINIGTKPTEVAVRTLDWTFSESGEVTFFDELREGSCRPWVTIERRFVKLNPQQRLSFRIQVDVPAEVTRRECRFMVAIEGVEPAYRAQMLAGAASLTLPVSGRIAVAVYVMVDGAEPKLEIRELGVTTIRGKRQPVVTVANTGDAHGRLEGALESVDARGQKFELVPDGTPVLPGQQRVLQLQPRTEQGKKPIEPVLPIQAEGQFDWEMGSFKVKTEFK